MRAVTAVAALAFIAFAGCLEQAEEIADFTPDGPDTVRPGRPLSPEGDDDPFNDGRNTSRPAASEYEEPVEDDRNRAPIVGFYANRTNGTVPFNVTFSFNASDLDGDAISWTFDADGDGVPEGSADSRKGSFTVEYLAEGAHQATFHVTDGMAFTNRTLEILALGEDAANGDEAPAEDDGGDPRCPTDEDAVAAGPFYATVFDPPGNLWIYEESNGIAGLQRDDDTVPTDCPNPDTIIF